MNSVIGNYEKFVQIATEIPWFPMEEQHGDWFNTYPLGICVDLVHFPKEYVVTNFLEAFVRTALCSIAAADKWDKDFLLFLRKNGKSVCVVSVQGCFIREL